MTALPRMTENEQMMAQVVLGVAIDLFTTAEQETFTRAEALVILDSVRTDPLFFDAGMVIAHEEVDKVAREAISAIEGDEGTEVTAPDPQPEGEPAARVVFSQGFLAELRAELVEAEDGLRQAEAMMLASEPAWVRATGARLRGENARRIAELRQVLELGGEGR